MSNRLQDLGQQLSGLREAVAEAPAGPLLGPVPHPVETSPAEEPSAPVAGGPSGSRGAGPSSSAQAPSAALQQPLGRRAKTPRGCTSKYMRVRSDAAGSEDDERRPLNMAEVLGMLPPQELVATGFWRVLGGRDEWIPKRPKRDTVNFRLACKGFERLARDSLITVPTPPYDRHKLRELCLRDAFKETNPSTPAAVAALAGMLPSLASRLQRLALQHNDPDWTGVELQHGSEGGLFSSTGADEALATPLASLTRLEQLDIAGSNMGSKSMSALAAAPLPPSLTSLGLRSCGLDNEVCVPLSQALAGLHSLSKLELSCNNIGPEGMAAQSAALLPASLSDIDLRAFSIGKQGQAAALDAAGPGPLLRGQPADDAVVLALPDGVATQFSAHFAAHPRITEFDPNFNPDERKLEEFSRMAAVAIYDALAAHAPAALPLLQQLEARYKGGGGDHAPHVLIRNLRLGPPVERIPTSDDPKQDPGYFGACGPCLSELFLLGWNALLGFARLPVSGEKGGVPVHHHVPMQQLASSRTSVCFKTPIAVHTEDVHAPHVYGHFYLFGKLGNPGCATPLLSTRSFLSAAAAATGVGASELLRGMRLPYLHRPGAGRVDGAPERLIAPLMDSDWGGREFLRFNGADYHSIASGEHVYRHYVLPGDCYASPADRDLAELTLRRLRDAFRDVDALVRGSPNVWPLCIDTGDLVMVGNKAGPHSRTTFAGPRYVQRLYADYNPATWWAVPGSMEARVELWRASSCCDGAAGDDHAPTAGAAPSLAAAAGLAGSSELELGRLDSTISQLRFLGQEHARAFLGVRASGAAAGLAGPLGRVHALLVAERSAAEPAAAPAPAERPQAAAVAAAAAALSGALEPLVQRITKHNVREEIDRLRTAVASTSAAHVEGLARALEDALAGF